MSDSIERILEILDHGLQRSTEPGFGFDPRPAACFRCFATVDAGDLCPPCRSFLLGDAPEGRKIPTLVDEDHGPPYAPYVFDRWNRPPDPTFFAEVEALLAALADLARQVLAAFDRLVFALLEAIDDVRRFETFRPRSRPADHHRQRAPEATPRSPRQYHRRRT